MNDFALRHAGNGRLRGTEEDGTKLRRGRGHPGGERGEPKKSGEIRVELTAVF